MNNNEISAYAKGQLEGYLQGENGPNKLELFFQHHPETCNKGYWELGSLSDGADDLWIYTAEKDELFTLEAMVLEFNPNEEDSYATTGMQLIKLPHSGMADLLKIGLTGGFEQRTVLLKEGQTINAFSMMESFNFIECQNPETETFLIITGRVEENLSL